MTLTCFACGKRADQLEEFTDRRIIGDLTPEAYVLAHEGTLNRATDHFCCTPCYLALGLPSSPGGWIPP